MLIRFGNEKTELVLEETNNELYIKEISCFNTPYVKIPKGIRNSYVFLVGQAYPGKMFHRYNVVAERLNFVEYSIVKHEDKEELKVVEKNDIILVTTFYTLHREIAVLQCRKEVKNISNEKILLECVMPLCLKGIMQGGEIQQKELGQIADPTSCIQSLKTDKIEFPTLWKAYSTWCSEACFEEFDLQKEGLRAAHKRKRYGKISVSSNGSQTTHKYLPLGLFQEKEYGYFLFEILPVGSWNYDVLTTVENELHLCLTGKTLAENGWYKELECDEVHKTEEVRIVGAKELDNVLYELTCLRRQVKRKTHLFPHKEIIYNVFMHNVWPNPHEDKDKMMIPGVSEIGADYYVIDAGWFDNGLTTATGIWDECEDRYPSGLVKTIEKVRRAGMKFGIWLELQSVGTLCQEKNLLPEYCYFHIAGKRPVCNGRYQINFAVKEVREYADGIIKKIVDRYSPDYIKLDYNQIQYGAECDSGSLTEGLSLHMQAYNQWFFDIQERYPDIVFENCASGGMMMDSNQAANTTIFSVSDQESYDNYPPSLANMPFAVLPEQMGVWNICVDSRAGQITDEMVIMNSINSFYGVMHLSSKLEKLTENQKSLVKEGMAYYRSIGEIKDKAIPIMPNGFASFDDEIVFTGLRHDEKIYLSVYNLSLEDKTIEQDLSKYGVREVDLVYPRMSKNKYNLKNGVFSLEIQAYTARCFEFIVKK